MTGKKSTMVYGKQRADKESRQLKQGKKFSSHDSSTGASLSKLIQVTQSHLSQNDTNRLGSITESLPIVHSEHEISRDKEEKHDRGITRQMATKDLNKWNYFVNKLNSAEHVEFPLRSSTQDSKLHTMSSLVSPTLPETSLEKKLNEIYARTGLYDNTSSPFSSDIGMIPLRKQSLNNTTDILLEGPESADTSNILAKLKAVMSYDVKKRKRANKIKSKQYHRMRRKEEDKAQEAKNKQLFEVDPKAAALYRKRFLEKQRAYERATMRHKNTSKFIKHVKRAAMWDSEKRHALQQQDEIHRQRTEKPLLASSDASSEDDEGTKPIGDEIPKVGDTPIDVIEKNREGLRKMAFMQKEIKEDKENELEEKLDSATDSDIGEDNASQDFEHDHTISKLGGRICVENRSNIPVKIHIPQNANDFDRDIEHSQEMAIDDQPVQQPRDEQEDLIREAFAEDEILQDLIKEKESAIEREAKPVDKNQALPGWNEWGGLAQGDSDLNRTQRARMARLEAKRKIELDVLRQKRRDVSLAHVYINEEIEAAIPQDYISRKPPYPFESQAQYEESIRLPLGKEWNTALTVEQNTKPAVRTKKGRVIEPLDSAVHPPKTVKTKITR